MYQEIIKSEDPNVRYIVQNDDTAPNPLDYYEPLSNLGVYNFGIIASGYSSSSEIVRTGTLADRIAENLEDGSVAARSWEDVAAATNRALSILGRSERISIHSHRGYSQSDWAKIWVEAEPDAPVESLVSEWSMWARGDVYGVTRQIRTECDSCDCDDWEDGESLWGIYADDAEEAVKYFSETY